MDDNKTEVAKEVVLNNQKLNENQFAQKKKECEEKGIKIVEIKPGIFRTKLEG
jgi:hypothetical protein